MNILTINLVCSTILFWIIARIYILPKLAAWEARSVIMRASRLPLDLSQLSYTSALPEPVQRRRSNISVRS